MCINGNERTEIQIQYRETGPEQSLSGDPLYIINDGTVPLYGVHPSLP